MPIMKKKVYENFTVVDNYYIDDIECKPEFMGYLTYMLRKPENWNFTFKSIMKDLGVGERNVRTNIQRLETQKYIKRERSRDENGNFIWIYYIYNKPYDLGPNKENLPYVRNGHVDGEHIQTDQIIINTNNSKDKIDKTAEAEIIPDEISHNKLTEELINLKYIDEKDQMRPFYFDNLFNEYLLAGRKYVELFSGIHYIVPRVISNGFKDENGNDIKNRFAYFKSALESNFSKLENLGKDLYPDDDSLWKDFETNKVKDMAWMFGIGNTQYNNGARSKLQSLDVSNFNTSNVTNMEGMFQYLELIPELDVSGFDTKNVANMAYIFNGLRNVDVLDVSGFDTSKVTNMSCMFQYCVKLKNIDVSRFDTSKVTNMGWMFNYCQNVENLDVSGFNTSNVANMQTMFQRCEKITSLDLSNFDTSKVTTMGWMFYGCYNLRTIYASENFVTNNVTLSTNMFYGDSNLKGGNGTLYNSGYRDKTYARIDTEETPGYFTLKSA